jgi:signal transduction histidine kinase
MASSVRRTSIGVVGLRAYTSGPTRVHPPMASVTLMRWWRTADAALAAVLFGIMTAELAARPVEAGEQASRPIAYLLALLITAPIAVHRRVPVVAVVVSGAAIAAYGAGHFVAFPGYAAFGLVFVISLHCGRGRGVFAYGIVAAALGTAIALQAGPTVTPSTWISTALALTVAWLAGDNLRVRADRMAALRARADRLERERENRDRQAVADERLRIARELHDVVAHSMSVIAVQAGVANHVIDSRPELARTALATVETTARAALVEMRRLLGVLRRPDEPEGSLSPAPGLADVPGLIAQFAEAGLAVEVSMVGTAVQVPDGVDLSAYRIAQEGLTNVLRHGGPKAWLTIGHRPGWMRVAVADDGRPGRSDTPAGGHGLIGMRERVALFGGTLTAGPRADGGGFELVATLPYGEPA